MDAEGEMEHAAALWRESENESEPDAGEDEKLDQVIARAIEAFALLLTTESVASKRSHYLCSTTILESLEL